MRQAFLTLPKEIHEAAEIDGCTNFKFLYTIGVPLIKPSLGALIIYVFLQSWNYYLWPLLVTDSVNMRTVQIGLGMLQGAEATDFRPVMAGYGYPDSVDPCIYHWSEADDQWSDSRCC